VVVKVFSRHHLRTTCAPTLVSFQSISNALLACSEVGSCRTNARSQPIASPLHFTSRHW